MILISMRMVFGDMVKGYIYKVSSGIVTVIWSFVQRFPFTVRTHLVSKRVRHPDSFFHNFGDGD